MPPGNVSPLSRVHARTDDGVVAATLGDGDGVGAVGGVEHERRHPDVERDAGGDDGRDTEVAQHLLKTVNAARLLGAHCTICGIRPQVAQTIVALGIEFGDIATKATLADALAYALTNAGLKVVPA